MNWATALRLADLRAEEARVLCVYREFYTRLEEMQKNVLYGFVEPRYVESSGVAPPFVESVTALQGRMVVLDSQCKDMVAALERLNARQAEQALGQEKT